MFSLSTYYNTFCASVSLINDFLPFRDDYLSVLVCFSESSLWASIVFFFVVIYLCYFMLFFIKIIWEIHLFLLYNSYGLSYILKI
jgi:hypothetical protein